MAWLILGAFEGTEGIRVVFENQDNHYVTSRFFDAAPRPDKFVGTPLHKMRLADPADYEFDPKDFLGRFTGLIAGKGQSDWEEENENN